MKSQNGTERRGRERLKFKIDTRIIHENNNQTEVVSEDTAVLQARNGHKVQTADEADVLAFLFLFLFL